MVITRVTVTCGSAEQRPKHLKRGKGKSSIKPTTSIEVLTPATLGEPVAAQAIVDVAFDYFKADREREMEKVLNDPTY